ncbi:AAA family ATPase [Lysobacter sp. CFH 32150]|uniref:AAA family ATPase n=1 Tax=Lysobacter sp. CFH 32150 TaxID=2927128 RepID=UPI001FA7042D|nr:AAA family ATPase [Lysobacter sp. CFH 32150]MCI4567565.1 AAA family ATPase [Lysobacter sp. CFH 32150]
MSAVEVETPQGAARRLAASAIRDGFQPAALHCYCDVQGRPLFWRIRAKHPDGRKWMRPMRFDGAGYSIGEPAAPAEGKPLYRLPELLADPTALVWIVEGEACVDALAKLGLVATTSGGESSTNVADWSPLRGRSARLWPDNDAAGARYADAVAAVLKPLGCDLRRLNVTALNLHEKGDAVDWIATHPDATAAEVEALPLEKQSKIQTPENGPRVILRRGSDVQPVAVDWLWPGWLAAGKLHLIGGAPGTGKTTIASALAATVTMGGRWPDGSRAEAGSVVIWSGEDDHADTLNPRLRAAGANMQRVHVVEGIDEAGRRYPFDPAQDMDALREALHALPDVRLIVVDPVVSAVAGDSHKNAEVRRGLQPLVDLAGELRCALLGVTHFSKGTAGRDPVERITGSLAFAALARLVMVTAKQEAEGDRPERRVMLRAKSNIGPDGGGFVYDLQQSELDDFPGVTASRVLWGESVTGSARELLAEAEAVDGERSATDEAADWLRYTLEAEPMAAGEVLKLAKLSGISDKALRTARERIGIKPKRSGFGRGSSVIWALPPIDAQPAHTCPLKERASMEEKGIYGNDEGVEVIEL